MTVPESWITNFFVAGGTLRPDSPSYVDRPADQYLFERTLGGELCYVLTARQMGKSSLMIRTAIRLREEKIQTAIIDLTKIGTSVTVTQWYVGLLTQLKRNLRLQVVINDWWTAQAGLSEVQRFTLFMRDVVLTEIRGPVVIFIDEIDATLKLEFSDDFFAAIRSLHNARADDGIYQRLTFALLGVATPTELIKDRRQTPFNIGQPIHLADFSSEDMDILQIGLESVYPGYGEMLSKRIYFWTNGHPYLTQKLCLFAVESEHKTWTVESIDHLVSQMFFSKEATRETNLQFVQDTIDNVQNKERLLTLYRQIYEGAQIADNENSQRQKQLKLIGLAYNEGGVLRVRNEIYRHVFGLEWIKQNMPTFQIWSTRLLWVSVLLALMLLVIVVIEISEPPPPPTPTVAPLTDSEAFDLSNLIRTTPDAESRLTRLGRLFASPQYRSLAHQLFGAFSADEQVALFTEAMQTDQHLITVIKELYTDPTHSQNDELLTAMAEACHRSQQSGCETLVDEINLWLSARAEADLTGYNQTIDLNSRNPATHFERAKLYEQRGEWADALLDFEATIELDGRWQIDVEMEIMRSASIYNTLQLTSESYPFLAALIPTPTLTPTPTDIPPTATPTRTATATPTGTSSPTATATPTNTPIIAFPTVTPQPTATATPEVAPSSLTPTEFIPPTPVPVEVIYAQSNQEQHELWLWNPTTGTRRLHQFAAAPAVANGRVIFFGQPGINQLGGEYRKGSGLWLMTTATGEISQLKTEDHIRNLAISPDGQRLAYEVAPPPINQAESVIMTLSDGTELGRIPAEQPAWHADSRRLTVKACAPACGLWDYGLDGSRLDLLTNNSTDSYPVWSPDGKLLSFSSRDRHGNWEIYLLDVDSRQLTRLTQRPATDTTPVFSPDGLELYFRTDSGGSWRIVALNLNRRTERVIRSEIGVSNDWGLARPALWRLE